jgi:hypothetical protein
LQALAEQDVSACRRSGEAVLEAAQALGAARDLARYGEWYRLLQVTLTRAATAEHQAAAAAEFHALDKESRDATATVLRGITMTAPALATLQWRLTPKQFDALLHAEDRDRTIAEVLISYATNPPQSALTLPSRSSPCCYRGRFATMPHSSHPPSEVGPAETHHAVVQTHIFRIAAGLLLACSERWWVDAKLLFRPHV